MIILSVSHVVALKAALKYAKSNGVTRRDIAAIANVTEKTIANMLGNKHKTTLINWASVIHACGANSIKYIVSMK